MRREVLKTPLAYQRHMALNAICPYFTMFPLEYPLKVLKKHRPHNPVVMDPFCGRGTTLFAARQLGLKSWGIDTSPVAVAIAKAKLAQATFEDILDLASTFVHGIEPIDVPDSSFFKKAFHRKTLKEICSIREGLLSVQRDTNESVLLRAAMLGCLHGPQSKDTSNSGYFSNQMPRTFSSKPEYALSYWKTHSLIAKKQDVLQVLARKLERISETGETQNSFSHVRLGSSELISTLPGNARNFSVVVTSPPYYGMRTYVPDQWLRNWFLGGPPHVDYSGHPQLCHTGQNAFAQSLGKVWRNMASTQAESLEMYVRFGVIPSSPVDAIQLFSNSLEESGLRWKCVYTASASSADAGKRQADQWNAKSTPVTEYDFHVRRVD